MGEYHSARKRERYARQRTDREELGDAEPSITHPPHSSLDRDRLLSPARGRDRTQGEYLSHLEEHGTTTWDTFRSMVIGLSHVSHVVPCKKQLNPQMSFFARRSLGDLPSIAKDY